jgi:hypothetical protein
VVAADENVEHHLVVPLTSLLIMAATISKGTLNLRFMQNSQRAEQELEINSADAEPVMKDESHWEVSREVKEMWGITSEPSSSSSRYAATPCLKLKFTIADPLTHDQLTRDARNVIPSVRFVLY